MADGAEHVLVGSRWLTRDVIPRTVVVLSLDSGVAWLRDEDSGEQYAEVARYMQSTWTRRANRSDMPAVEPKTDAA